MRVKALDLRKEVPRSPQEKLGGLAHLPRMLDKARAKAAETQGEYIYPCPLDQSLLQFLDVTEEDFFRIAQVKNDEEVLQWLRSRKQPNFPGPEEIEGWNRAFLLRTPETEESRRYFLELRGKVAPDRPDVTTWVDLLDLDEGRQVPVRASV